MFQVTDNMSLGDRDRFALRYQALTNWPLIAIRQVRIMWTRGSEPGCHRKARESFNHRRFGGGPRRLQAPTSGDDLDRVMAMPATHTIRLEIVPIDREHSTGAERLRRRHERCVRQVHRMISV